jgi:glycerate kinase
MRYLIAPDKFKGSLSAAEVAQTLREAIHSVQPTAEIECLPIADGGEGTASLLAEHLGAERRLISTVDPLGRPIEAEYFLSGTEAIVEMSAASGLWRVLDTAKRPFEASTRGTGIVLRHLMDIGVRRVLIGLGGSATVDLGLGMAAELGYQFLEHSGRIVDPIPARFPEIANVIPPSDLKLPEVIGLFDVETRLTGTNGAIYTFGPQKGLTAAEVDRLDRIIAMLVARLESTLRTNFSDSIGAGAAGGFGYGIKTFLNGSLDSGFNLVAERLALTEKIRRADVVITGEGKLDSQSLQGKGPFGVALIARKLEKPVWVVAGSISDRPVIERHFDKISALMNGSVGLDEALKNGKQLLRQRTLELLRSGNK